MQADWLFRLERFRDAEELLRKWLMVQSSPSAPAQAVLSQAIARQPGRYLEAMAEAQRAIAQDPADPAGYHALTLLQMDGDPAGALAALEKALLFAPDRPVYYALQARVHLKMKQPRQALEAIEIACRLDPQNVACIQIHAVALLNCGKAKQAREVIQTALRMAPADADVHNALGWIMLRQGEAELARLHLSEALRINPKLETARSGLSHALKARYPLYRWLTNYGEWLQKHLQIIKILLLVSSTIMAIVIYPLVRSDSIGLQYANIIRICGPVWLLLFLAMGIPWLSMPFYDLLLRFDPFGQLSLTREQIWLTDWIIAAFICTMLSALEFLISRSGMNTLAVFAISMIISGFVIGFPYSHKR